MAKPRNSRIFKKGQTLGRYTIVRFIAAGGMGEVYEAYDPKLERNVAIKTLSPDLLNDEDSLKRFSAEGITLARINHPNVMSVYEVELDSDKPYLVMEYIEGMSLADLSNKTSLDVHESIYLFQQILEGLGAIHKEMLIHRDLKTTNIIVDRNGHLKIIDFGVAKDLAGNVSDLTSANMIVGSLGYLAPEVVRGLSATHSSDIWSAGLILYKLLVGKLPFTGNNNLELIDQIKNKSLDFPIDSRAFVPLSLRNIVSKMCEKDIANRYNSTVEVKTALNDFLSKNPHLQGEKPVFRNFTISNTEKVIKHLKSRGLDEAQIHRVIGAAARHQQVLERDADITLGSHLAEMTLTLPAVHQALSEVNEKVNSQVRKERKQQMIWVVTFCSVLISGFLFFKHQKMSSDSGRLSRESKSIASIESPRPNPDKEQLKLKVLRSIATKQLNLEDQGVTELRCGVDFQSEHNSLDLGSDRITYTFAYLSQDRSCEVLGDPTLSSNLWSLAEKPRRAILFHSDLLKKVCRILSEGFFSSPIKSSLRLGHKVSLVNQSNGARQIHSDVTIVQKDGSFVGKAGRANTFFSITYNLTNDLGFQPKEIRQRYLNQNLILSNMNYVNRGAQTYLTHLNLSLSYDDKPILTSQLIFSNCQYTKGPLPNY